MRSYGDYLFQLLSIDLSFNWHCSAMAERRAQWLRRAGQPMVTKPAQVPHSLQSKRSLPSQNQLILTWRVAFRYFYRLFLSIEHAPQCTLKISKLCSFAPLRPRVRRQTKHSDRERCRALNLQQAKSHAAYYGGARLIRKETLTVVHLM